MSIILFYVPCDNENAARTMAYDLIKKKLAICANIIPNVVSIYPWNEKIAEEKEVILVLKTHNSCKKNCKNRIAKLHPYDTPAIISIATSNVNKKFLKWSSSLLFPDIK